MTTDIPTLVAEARGFAAGSESARATLLRDLADAIEAEHRRAVEGPCHHQNTAYLRIMAERDRYREAIEYAERARSERNEGVALSHRLRGERDRYRDLCRRTELQCQDVEKVSDRYRAAIEDALASEERTHKILRGAAPTHRESSQTWRILTAALDETKGQD